MVKAPLIRTNNCVKGQESKPNLVTLTYGHPDGLGESSISPDENSQTRNIHTHGSGSGFS